MFRLFYVSPNHRGCRVTIYKEWEQTFRPALYMTDTANLHLAMPWLFSGLAWLNCLISERLCLIGKAVLIARLIEAGQRLALTRLGPICLNIVQNWTVWTRNAEKGKPYSGIWIRAGLWCDCSLWLCDGPIEPATFAWLEEQHWKSPLRNQEHGNIP